MMALVEKVVVTDFRRDGRVVLVAVGPVVFGKPVLDDFSIQGFTITGARQRLEGEQSKSDVSRSHQIVKQIRTELEEVLQILKR